MMGTPDYMSPEQVENGVVTPASDVYSLGLVVYEMLTGARPFKSDSAFESAVKRLRHAPKNPRALVPDIDPRCELAILKCLQIDPAQRGGALEAISAWSDKKPRFGSLFARFAALRAPRTRVWMAFAVAFAVVALLYTVLRFYNRRPSVSAGSTVLLTNIENLTGDRQLDGITVALRSQLNQSEFFKLVDPSRVRDGLERMVLPPDHALDPATARELAKREGAPLVVYGSLSQLAQEYQLSLKLEHIPSGSLLPGGQWRNSWAAGTKRKLFEAVHLGSEWVRKQAGEARQEIVAEDRPPEETTTDSWEALKSFSLAEERKAQDRPAEAIELLREATDRDPQFALAWMRAGDLELSLNRSQQGYADWRRALAVMDSRRLTTREQLRIQGLYAFEAGDYGTAGNAFRRYSAHYPNDYLPWFYLAGPLMMRGKTDEAINALEEARKRQPDAYYTVSHLGMLQILNGSTKAVPPLAAWLRAHGQEASALSIEGSAAFVDRDFSRAENRFSLVPGSPRPEWRSRGYRLQACIFAERGRIAEARKALADGIDFDTSQGDASGRADKLLALGYLDLRAHDLNTLGTHVKQALEFSLNAAQVMQAGTLLARANSLPEASATLKRLDATLEGPLREIAKHRIAGEIFLTRKQTAQAIAEFEKADAIEPPSLPATTLRALGKPRETAKKLWPSIGRSSLLRNPSGINPIRNFLAFTPML